VSCKHGRSTTQNILARVLAAGMWAFGIKYQQQGRWRFGLICVGQQDEEEEHVRKGFV